jgi:hypothetical protein
MLYIFNVSSRLSTEKIEKKGVKTYSTPFIFFSIKINQKIAQYFYLDKTKKYILENMLK